MLRVLVVDDEPLARKRLCSAISRLHDAEVVREASTGAEALAAIACTDPSVVLLDIEMPEGDGFHVLTAILQQPRLPEIIFVTAYSNYAVRAYEHGAADYLLKPFTLERLDNALARARERIRLNNAEERAARLQLALQSFQDRDDPAKPVNDIWLRLGGENVRVAPESIQRVSADRDYVTIHTKDRQLYLRRTVTAMFEQLGPELFVRIHRSHIVNRAAIRTFRTRKHGKSEVELDSGLILPVGASYLSDLKALTDST